MTNIKGCKFWLFAFQYFNLLTQLLSTLINGFSLVLKTQRLNMEAIRTFTFVVTLFQGTNNLSTLNYLVSQLRFYSFSFCKIFCPKTNLFTNNWCNKINNSRTNYNIYEYDHNKQTIKGLWRDHTFSLRSQQLSKTSSFWPFTSWSLSDILWCCWWKGL